MALGRDQCCVGVRFAARKAVHNLSRFLFQREWLLPPLAIQGQIPGNPHEPDAHVFNSG
jgi:hypothetical protein